VHDFAAEGALKLRTTLGTGFRAPSLYELDYNRGPYAYPPASLVDLKEESSRGYDIGIDYDRGRLHVEATYFNQRIGDELYFDLRGFSGYLQSLGTSISRGVELAARTSVGERFEFSANVTRNSTRDTTNEQRLRRPRLFSNLAVSFSPPGNRVRVLANYRFARDAVDVGFIPLDDYEVLDVSFDYSLGERLAFFARIENAGNERYEEVAGYNTAARSAYAGVRVRLE
jgi:vitamin B12 transporter